MEVKADMRVAPFFCSYSSPKILGTDYISGDVDDIHRFPCEITIVWEVPVEGEFLILRFLFSQEDIHNMS